MSAPSHKAAKTIPLALPAIQHWSCHNCGAGCCRQHAIEVTEEERQRILAQGWTAQDGVPAGAALFTSHAGPAGERCYRLAHRADGACVFLDERGLCRIHAKFGEPAKPLACRVYPYAFHPAGDKVTVSLRFSCPSVVANRGQSMQQNRSEIQRLARAVVPEGYALMPPPVLSRRRALAWPEILHFAAALDDTLAPVDAPMTVKLQRALAWLAVAEQAQLEVLQGKQMPGYLAFIREAACKELPAQGAPLQPGDAPSALARMLFRQLTAQYARRDTAVDLAAGWPARLRLLGAVLRFTGGAGLAPPLQPVFRTVPFASLEQPFGIPAESEALWTRYFRVKVQGLHFCGPAYYGLPLVEGFKDLALLYPATMWIARWLAASQGRDRLLAADVEQALAIADHHHGYSPVFNTFGFRSRIMILSQWGEIPKLIRWYAR